MKFNLLLAATFCWILLYSTTKAQSPNPSEQVEKLFSQAVEYHK